MKFWCFLWRFSGRLYELRKSRNLTQSAVAYRLNLSLSRLSAYENGENNPCDVLRNSANFYGVSIDYILCFSDSKTDNCCSSLRLSEQKLLDMYRNLTPDAKALIDGTASTIYWQKSIGKSTEHNEPHRKCDGVSYIKISVEMKMDWLCNGVR